MPNTNTNTTPHRHYRLAALQLAQQGYRCGPPSRVPAAAVQMDRETWALGICDHCSHRGLDARPFGREEDGSYVLLIVCPRCHHATEG
jgi:hypothetical protein